MTRTRTVRPRLPRWVALGAAVAVVAGSGGCAGESGAAGVVDGRRISVEQVQQAAADLEAFSGQPVAQQQVLYFLVIGPYVIDAAARAGVGVSQNDARTQLADQVEEPSQGGVEALQAAQAVSRLTSLSEDQAKPVLDGVVNQLRSADIDLSPRYGEFDKEQLTIAPPQENWIEAEGGTAP